MLPQDANIAKTQKPNNDNDIIILFEFSDFDNIAVILFIS